MPAELVALALELWPPPATRTAQVARRFLAKIVGVGEPPATIYELDRYLRRAKDELAKLDFPLAVACRPEQFRAWLTATRRRDAANDAAPFDDAERYVQQMRQPAAPRAEREAKAASLRDHFARLGRSG